METINLSNYEKNLLKEGINELRINIDNRIKQILKTKTYNENLKATSLNEGKEELKREVEVLEQKEKSLLKLYNEVLKWENLKQVLK